MEIPKSALASNETMVTDAEGRLVGSMNSVDGMTENPAALEELKVKKEADQLIADCGGDLDLALEEAGIDGNEKVIEYITVQQNKAQQ